MAKTILLQRLATLALAAACGAGGMAQDLKYVFMFIEAMADAAVAEGMPRPQAYQFAAQAVYGSAKMVMETGKHPGELKDMVTSPGGTTIEGCEALEKGGMRAAVMECINAGAEKSLFSWSLGKRAQAVSNGLANSPWT